MVRKEDVGVLSMDKNNFVIFKEIEKQFIEIEDNYIEKIKYTREMCSRQIISKGIMFNVYPFEAQRHGWKVSGKEISKVIMKDNCYIYYFDDKNKIRLVENVSEFLGKIHYFVLYDYKENGVYSCRCISDKLISMSFAKFVDGICVEKYTVGHEKWNLEKYIYKDGKLMCIDIFQIYNNIEMELKEVHKFYYNINGKLELIQRKCPNGYSENLFSDKRLQYKKIEKNMEADLQGIIDLFTCNQSGMEMSAIGFRLWIDDINPMIQINFETSIHIPDLLSEWKFSDFGIIHVADVPIDEKQQKKIKIILIKTIVKFIENNVLCCKVKLIENDDINIIENSAELKKYLTGVDRYFI